MSSAPRRILATSAGTAHGHFGPTEWTLVALVSLIWGSSYLWIALGLESFAPGLVAWLRLAFGAAALWMLPKPAASIDSHDWWVIGVVAIAGNAGPALLFALAETTLESSVVGMLTAATPLATLGIAVGLGNRTLRPIHVLGLVLGLVGVVAMSADNVVGRSAGAGGVAYVLLAITGYALTSNVIGPLVERYGAVAVILRAQLVAVVVMTPTGFTALDDSTFSWKSMLAVAVLGIFGTGIARSLQATLISRSGAPRASIVGYLIPVVAAVLGVMVLSESLTAVESAGLGVITLGAYLGSRRIGPHSRLQPRVID